MPFAASVAIACTFFLLAGALALRRVHAAALFELPFTSVLFGQMGVWAAAVVLLPLGAGIDRWLGASPPIGVWLWGTLAAGLVLTGGRFDPPASRAGLLLAAAGVGSLVKVALAYSTGSHLGALGLDTHQHIYWTRQLLDAHHVPLVERGTPILALYPRGFHLLTALWSAAGVVGPVGPWIKLMPFLQALLPCASFAELLCVRAQRRAHAVPLAGLLALSLVVYAFAQSRMAYPEYDLNGTPRYASGAVLLFPLLVLVAGEVLESARLRALAWECVPAVALLLLSLNAVLLVQLAVFALPILAIVWGFVGRRKAATIHASWLAASCAVALGVALQDPWIVAQWAPHMAPGYLAGLGIVTPDRASALGALSPDELVHGGAAPTLYATSGDFARLFASSLVAGARDLMHAGWHFPFPVDLLAEHGRIALRLAIAACAAAGGWAALRNRDRNADSHRRLLVALVVAACVGGFAQAAFFHFADGLAEGRGYEFALLRDYCQAAPKHTTLSLQAMVLFAALAWAAASWRAPAALDRREAFAVASVVLAALPFWLYGTTECVDPARGFWAPVDAADIAHLRALEAHVGPEEGVLVPAAAWGIGEERWIVPQGPTAAVLPFAERRMLFNSRLGPSVFFSWRDLARFCEGSDGERGKFLARNDVRWFLLKDAEVASGAAPRRFRMCKLRPAQLGVVTPPVYIEGDLALFRVDPARLEDR